VSPHLPRTVRAIFALLLVAGALAGCGSGGASTSTAPPPTIPFVRAQGSNLVAGGHRFIAFGFNYAGRNGSRPLYSFADPSAQHLQAYLRALGQARRLGANTMRIYLQLFDFIHRSHGRIRVDQTALAHLRAVLAAAERLHLYLDLTGDLVWVPGSSPRWYDAMGARRRWRVQARFWSAVSRVAAPSPAVLCYELTSAPRIGVDSHTWYTGRFGGLDFTQFVVKHAGGRDPDKLARQWITVLSRAIRSNDSRHLIGIGLSPALQGPFGPANVGRLLDVLLVHLYPHTGHEASSLLIAGSFAAQRKPVILGETAILHDNRATQASFLLRSRRFFDGYLSFFFGHGPQQSARTPAARFQNATLAQFLGLRSRLTHPTGGPTD
jgi:hypothetical protein